jgi:predicted GIY-YIG superfamily endonuclease
MAPADGWYVYILECGDGTLYTGIARDPQERLRLHQAGKGARYTRSRLPLRLRYTEPQPGQGAALRREMAIKKLSRKEKLRLIAVHAATR